MANAYKPEGLLFGNVENGTMIYGGRQGLEKAMASGVILEGMVILCDKDMNLHIDLKGIDGIIPKSEVCYNLNEEEIKDIAIITRVGKPVCFKVIGIEEKNGRTVALLSRRAAQIECLNNYLIDLIPGDIIPSRVTHLERFGAFVDIGCGIIALLTVDSISVSRFSHPKDRLYKGMVINTVLKSYDRENGRIFVSMRELLGTWEENAAKFLPGQTVTGIIRSVEEYGVFIELAPNLAGLAEIKEGTPSDSLQRDRCAAVYIKSIIPERMKIKLVLIDNYSSVQPLPEINYFVDCERVKHISSWRYSPNACNKIIETVFD